MNLIERPRLLAALLLVLAALFCLAGAYERDWWVFRRPPHVYKPSREVPFEEALRPRPPGTGPAR